MRVKPWATFTTDLPDDQVEDGRNISVYGGLNVAVAIGEVFAKIGCEVAEPYSVEEQGWEFLLSYRGSNKFSCRVCSFHPAFRLLLEECSFLPKVARKRAAYADLARALATALEADARFRDITWWASEEGPPEPDVISSVREDVVQGEPVSAEIDSTNYVHSEAQGCLSVVALLTLLTAATALVEWLWPGRLSSEERHEKLLVGLMFLGIGALAFWGGFRPGKKRREATRGGGRSSG
jgi:hypothetical protein